MAQDYYEHFNDGFFGYSGERTGCRCTFCGYEIHASDEKARIIANGDIIHKACWEEYAAENPDEFLQTA